MNPEERKQILSGKGKRQIVKKETPATAKGKDGEPAKPMTAKEQIISWTKTILGALLIVMIVNGLFIQSFVVPTGSMENEVMTGDFVFVNRFVYGGSTPQTIPFLNVPLPYLRLPGLRDPEKGDVIVFIYPGDRDEVEAKDFQYYLKRCVAVAGDTLEVREGYVYVNGVKENFPKNAQFKQNKYYSAESDKLRTFPKGMDFTRDNWGPLRIPKKGDVIPITVDNLNAWRIFIEREGHTIRQDGQLVRIDDQIADSYTVERDYVFGMGDNRNDSQDSRYWGFVPMENVVGTPLMVYWSWDPNERDTNGDPLYDRASGHPVERSFWSKLGSIRWGRIFNGID